MGNTYSEIGGRKWSGSISAEKFSSAPSKSGILCNILVFEALSDDFLVDVSFLGTIIAKRRRDHPIPWLQT